MVWGSPPHWHSELNNIQNVDQQLCLDIVVTSVFEAAQIPPAPPPPPPLL